MPLNPASVTFARAAFEARPVGHAGRVDTGLLQDVRVVVEAERVGADRDAVGDAVDRARAGEVLVEAGGVEAYVACRREQPGARRVGHGGVVEQDDVGSVAGLDRRRQVVEQVRGRGRGPLQGGAVRRAGLEVLRPVRRLVVLGVRIPDGDGGERGGARAVAGLVVTAAAGGEGAGQRAYQRREGDGASERQRLGGLQGSFPSWVSWLDRARARRPSPAHLRALGTGCRIAQWRRDGGAAHAGTVQRTGSLSQANRFAVIEM